MTQVITNLKEMSKKISSRLGFVPTMGAIHDGHLSLIEKSQKMSDMTVVSIFVNPLQFGENEDFDKYPKPLKKDIALIEKTGVNYIFIPEIKDLYPKNFSSSVDVSGISNILCGEFRPGHFSGVATIILKLLNIVKPKYLFLGQKDFQQTVVIKKMIQDFNIKTKVIISPTVRNQKGLAVSSRNSYLSNEELIKAEKIYISLKAGEKSVLQGEKDTKTIINKIKNELTIFDKIDYTCIANPETLKQPDTLQPDTTYLILVAARIKNIRLIDNILVKTN